MVNWPQIGQRVAHRRYVPLILTATVFVVVGWAAERLPAGRYTPESPEVRAIVARALQFLETKGLDDYRFGSEALAGLAFLKATGNASHPVVQAALERVRKNIPRSPEQLNRSEIVYGVSAATVFLCELDPAANRREIQDLLSALRQLQKPVGGWGYPAGHLHEKTGDTSMSQFAVLAIWEAARAGFPIPGAMVTGVATWFLRTQDPSGGWGYQGQVAPTGELVRQTDVRHSLSTAALASLYAISDLAGLRQKERKTDSAKADVIREVRRGTQEVGELTVRVDPKLLQAAINRAKGWYQANYTIDPPRYKYYYLYALERMWTFREYVEGTSAEASPWYDQGVEFLRATQRNDGSWEHECGQVPDTAFGVLFLVRSMKKSVEKVRSFGEGTLIGGRGLPKNTGDVTVIGGQVVAKPELANLEKFLAVLQEAEGEEAEEWLESLLYLPSQEINKLVSSHGEKLLALATAGSGPTRVMAIEALGRAGDMRAVPTLLLALEDSDADVVRAARDALRRIARLDKDLGPPDTFTPQQQREAARAWREWFLRVMPEAQFE